MSFPRNIYSEIENIDAVAANLTRLSQAFSATGNEKVADSLDEWASDLVASSTAIMNIIGAKVDEDFRRAREGSEAILKTALAVHPASSGVSALERDKNKGT